MNVLIIGLGSIADKHITALNQTCDHLFIQALRRRDDPETNHPLVENIFNWSDAQNPHFIIISNPTYLHAETIEKATNFNVPLFIEKPLFHKITETEKDLLTKLENEKIPTYVGCNLRFHPAIKALQKIIDDSPAKINEVNIYCGSYLPEWRKGDFRKYYSVDEELGGGVHLDLIHEMDYAVYLFGFPFKVFAFQEQVSSLRIKATDYAHYVLRYEGFCLTITLNYYRRDTKRSIEVVTDEGTISADLINCQIRAQPSKKVLFENKNFEMQETYNAQMQYFIANLGGKHMNDIEEAYNILKLALA